MPNSFVASNNVEITLEGAANPGMKVTNLNEKADPWVPADILLPIAAWKGLQEFFTRSKLSEEENELLSKVLTQAVVSISQERAIEKEGSLGYPSLEQKLNLEQGEAKQLLEIAKKLRAVTS